MYNFKNLKRIFSILFLFLLYLDHFEGFHFFWNNLPFNFPHHGNLISRNNDRFSNTLFVTKTEVTSTTYNSVREMFNNAQKLLDMGRNIEAQKLLLRCIEANPHDSHSWLSLARLEAKLGKLNDARYHFEKSLTYCPGNVYILHAWGHMEQKLGNITFARQFWSRALQIEPMNPYVCHAMSNLEKKLRNYDAAITLLQNVIVSKPTPELYISLAEIYTIQGKKDEARSTLQHGLEKFKYDKLKILLSLASLEEEVFSNTEEAMKLINLALSIDKKDIRIYVAKASIEIREKDFESARKTLQSTQNLQADDGKHFTMWSTLELRSGNVTEALRVLQLGSSKFPGDPFLLQRWGTVEAKCGDSVAARNLFRKSIQIRPHAPTFVAWAILEESEVRKKMQSENSDRVVALGIQPDIDGIIDIPVEINSVQDDSLEYFYGLNNDEITSSSNNDTSKTFSSKQIQLARLLFGLGMKADPQHGPLYHAFGNMENRLGNSTGARNIFMIGIAANCSDLASIYHAWGLMELKFGNVTAARTILHKGIRVGMKSYNFIDETVAFIMHSLGMLELDVNRCNEAKIVFSKALEFFPNQTQLLLGLASSYMKLGEYSEARKYFQESVSVDPHHAHAWQSWALAEKSLSNHDIARELFTKGVKNCPTHGALWQAYGMMEIEGGHLEIAKTLFEEAIKRCPNHAQSYQAWACLELKQGNYLKAKALVSMGLKRAPNHAALWTVAGLVEEKLGYVTRARQILNTGIKLFPSHGALYKVLGELEARQGSILTARTTFLKGLDADPTYAPLYHSSALMEAQCGDLEAISILRRRAKTHFQTSTQTDSEMVSIDSIHETFEKISEKSVIKIMSNYDYN